MKCKPECEMQHAGELQYELECEADELEWDLEKCM